jgi:Holliday junction resolvasome RuvABC endonuclease subunit
MNIIAVGIDAAFANMGFARVRITGSSLQTLQVQCLGLSLTQTEGDGKRRVVRKSSEELLRARQLHAAMHEACRGATFAFVEVPSGSQSAAAARSLGIAVGVLAGCPIAIIEVSPMEVKAAVAGKRVVKGASKADIIAWAAAKWPDAPWQRAPHKATVMNKKTGQRISLPAGRLLADNEHCADAMASVMAGIATPEFQRLLAMQAAFPPPVRRRVVLLDQ